MNRDQKSVVIKGLTEDFSSNQAAFIVGYQGMTVAQLHELRSQLRANGGRFHVAKARFIKRAVEGMEGAQDLQPYLKNQIGVVFALDQAPAVAKVLRNYAKEHEKLQLVAGCLENMILDARAIGQIADLPSREVLLAQVCGTLQAPIAGLANVLNILILRLLWTLKRIEETKQA